MMFNLILILSLISVFFYLLIIKYKIYFQNLYPDYNPIQKIHTNYTPPLAGLVIFVIAYTYYIINLSDSFAMKMYVLIPSLLIITIGVIEDIYGKVSASIRFVFIFISSIIFCTLNESLPSLEFWLIGDIINNNTYLKVLFFSICLTALSNGTNMIDGMNGLCGFTLLSIILSLISIIIIFEISKTYFDILFPLGVLISVFLLFNFPFGKIFLGDSGAYWLGWFLGAMILEIFSNNSLNTWWAIVIVFYPSMEVVFSTIRKVISKKSPFKSDAKHLHIKIFKTLKGPSHRSNNFNSFASLCLVPFYAVPPFTIMWSEYNPHISILILLGLVILYLIYFYLIPDIAKKN